jgi:two-component system, NtrC family, sensor kinase
MNASPDLKNNRILVIDDNRSICEDIRKILCGQEHDLAFMATEAKVFGGQPAPPPLFSFHVEAALQGEEGWRMVEAAEAAGHPYAMAFIDVRMPPGWDGVETIARIWQRFPELQVVLCTAFSDYSWEEMIRVIGRSDNLLILKKPFDSIEVLQLASALTQKWSLHHQVTCRLRDLDCLVAQRTLELQAANAQLKREFAEQRKLEHQLRQAQKMEAVGQLAAGIAHDFNNILTVVQGNASLLLAGKPPESPDGRPLQNICSAADRAAKLVAQLLTFCRKQVVELRPTHLRDTFAAITAIMPRVLTPVIKLDAHATPGLPMISADGPMMETLLLSLAVNARDAMPEGGILCITAAPVTLGPAEAAANAEARAGAFVRLSVSDTGAGIPPEILPRIFEPFFTTKPMGKGTGLGLATVYGIVQQHNGWVEVQSQVNHGTAFHIFLPALTAGDAHPAPSPAPVAKPPAGRETILVVDDEPDLRDLVGQVLESGGYKVLSAGSGVEALEQWAKRQGDVHLLLTDIVMPHGLTGRKLAEQLQSEDPRLRVIYTSGYTAGTPGTELANVDERSFLAKPYRPSMLLKLVRECLDRPCATTASAPAAAQQAA